MDRTLVLKALADGTRMQIITLLLKRKYCVRALAENLEISQAAVSQHLKVLREAGLLTGERKGYFMHYDVNRQILHQLAEELTALAETERENGSPGRGGCRGGEGGKCCCSEKGGDQL